MNEGFIIFNSNHMNELPKTYNPKEVEDQMYLLWEKSGKFNPDNLELPENAKNFCIPLPPPNATGQLHLGHAMYTIQDIMIRHARMQGKRTLWLPGTDHAAIATQNKVEKDIFNESGKTRHDLGREELVKRIEAFVEKSKSTINHQLRKMGFSLDWSRERFTLDEGVSEAVQQVFKKMYDDGLIYRGNRIVNWCPRCQSTLADDEVEYKEQQTPFYYFKYGPFVIGTVRPETKIGDKVVIVHPDDKRYKAYHNKEFVVPWIDGDVKAIVIVDTAADQEKGSGAMTITPAHSFVDFALAQKYSIETKNIIGTDGRLTKEAGAFAGLTTQEARQKFVEILQKKGLIDHIDEHYVNNLSVCYRCDTPIEPLVSPQWFVAVDKPVVEWKGKKRTLKNVAIEVVKSGDIKIVPKRFDKIYFDWMENLHDWCISRQLWYGHRIPVWYKGEKIHVDVEKPAGNGWLQDEDVLDTWFSSGTWTFSTLGWPKETEDLKNFHPVSVLETGYDILFFWVARMILMTTYAVGEVPFRTVYLHGLVRDKNGAKMSKSKGNGIDPLEMIEKFGTDALRLALVTGTTPGNDTRLYEEKIAGYRNFVNKFWNISRYILSTVKNPEMIKETPSLKTPADEWIIGKLHETIAVMNKKMQEHDYGLAIEALYQFTWSDFADWYIEISKIEKGKDGVLLYVLQTLLRLWHPYAPFITEHVYQMLGGHNETLMVETWPEKMPVQKTAGSQTISCLIEIVTAIRNIRAEMHIPYSQELLVSGDFGFAKEMSAIIESFGKVKMVKKLHGKTVALQKGLEIQLEGVVDFAKERSKTEKELKSVENYVMATKKKLANKKFTTNAPQSIVEGERGKLKDAQDRVQALKDKLKQLK